MRPTDARNPGDAHRMRMSRTTALNCRTSAMAKRSVSRRDAASMSHRSPSPTWRAGGGMKGSWTPAGARTKGRFEMGGKSIGPSS